MKKYSVLLLFICTLYSIVLEEFTYHTKFRKFRVGNTKIDILKKENPKDWDGVWVMTSK